MVQYSLQSVLTRSTLHASQKIFSKHGYHIPVQIHPLVIYRRDNWETLMRYTYSALSSLPINSLFRVGFIFGPLSQRDGCENKL